MKLLSVTSSRRKIQFVGEFIASFPNERLAQNSNLSICKRELTFLFTLVCCEVGDALFVSSQARDDLMDQLERYHDQVVKVSHDMTQAQWKRAQRMHAAESIPTQ